MSQPPSASASPGSAPSAPASCGSSRASGRPARRPGRPPGRGHRRLRPRPRARIAACDLSAYAWEDDPVALARRDDVDVLVELMGGADGPAKAAVEAALASGQGRGDRQQGAARACTARRWPRRPRRRARVIRFEAAVAGGIPVVKALTEGLAGNEITRVMGVMNGTCNYILTRMESDRA